MSRRKEIEEAAYAQFCNSSSVTFTLQFEAFIKGAEWADKTMIEKAYNWIRENVEDYLESTGYSECASFCIYVTDDFYNDFRKAMEE